MQIEEGKYYKTRDGRKVGPMVQHPYLSDIMWDGDHAGSRFKDGRISKDRERYEDLVAEWPTGPVVTEMVPKTRIVPGTYGVVRVDLREAGGVLVDIWKANPDADELDAAAVVLSALAKGLRYAT